MIIEFPFLRPNWYKVTVVNNHPHFILYLGRFAGNLIIYIDVTVDYLYLLARFAYQAFYVVFAGIDRIFENYYIPPLGFGEGIQEFKRQYFIALCNKNRLFQIVVKTTAWTT